jgi:hypothetical protein
MILAAGKITEIQQFTPPHFIIQHLKLDVAAQTDTIVEPFLGFFNKTMGGPKTSFLFVIEVLACVRRN